MLTDIATNLAEDDKPTVTVVTSRQLYQKADAGLGKKAIIDGVEIWRVWTSSFGRSTVLGRSLDYLSFYISCFFRLLIITHKGDIIIAKTDPPLISVIACLVSRAKGARSINWLQDLFPEIAKELQVITERQLLYRLLEVLRNWSLERATQNIVIGRLMRKKLIDMGISESKITYIPNWSHRMSSLPKEQNPLSNSWGLRDKFVVGYSGNLGRGHDVSTISRTIKLLAREEKIAFLFIGGGSGLIELKETLGDCCANVIFKPYQDRSLLNEALSVADIHIISLKSELEALMVPSKVYGILSVGKPILYIGNKNGEIATLVERNFCGYVISEGEAEVLTERIILLSSDAKTLDTMGMNARTLFDNLYDFPHAEKKWRNLLCSV